MRNGRTLIWIEMSALGNKKTDAFLAFDISVALCTKAGDGQADEAKAIVVADREIYVGLSVWVGEKELEDGVFSKETGAVETVIDEDGLLIWIEARVRGQEEGELGRRRIERMEIGVWREIAARRRH
jgi:hypothetical protein